MTDHPSWLDDERMAYREVWSTKPTCICVWATEPRRINGELHWPLRQRNRKCKLHGEDGDR